MLSRYGHLPPITMSRGVPGMPVAAPARIRLTPGAALLLLLAALAAGVGCAAPAPPRPPSEQVPDAVTDLRARQSGTAVVLHFTLPQHLTDGTRIAGPRRVEVYREFVAVAPPTPAAAAEPESGQAGVALAPPGRPAYTLDAEELAGDLVGDTVAFPDALTKTEFEAHRGSVVVYRVRTAAGMGGWSDLSGAASVTLVVPPAPVSGLTAAASAGAVTLRWSPPAPGAPPAPETFAVYRTRLNRDGSAAGAAEAVAVTTGTSYRDTSVEAGQSYRYTVRGMAAAPAGEVESADSAPVVVDVPALAKPAPPEGVAAIPVRQPSGSLEVDLSWAISGERNLAGYNVYRSEPGERAVRLNRQPLASATFRDTTVVPGRRYEYSVTSVDVAGNESGPSAPVTVTVPVPGAGSG